MMLYRGWFGGPVVQYRRRVVDGSKRLAAWYQLCMPGKPPNVESDNRREVVRLLCAAGHHRRAADLLGDSVAFPADLSILLRLPRELCAPLVAVMRKRSPWDTHKAVEKHRAPRRTKQVVDDLRRLYISALEDGITITPDHLAQVLGTWR